MRIANMFSALAAASLLVALGCEPRDEIQSSDAETAIEESDETPDEVDDIGNLESQFEKITDGMTLAEVEAIIGPGEQLPSPSFTVEGKEDAIGYRWTDGDYAILLDFHEGRVVSRAEQNPDPAKFFD